MKAKSASYGSAVWVSTEDALVVKALAHAFRASKKATMEIVLERVVGLLEPKEEDRFRKELELLQAEAEEDNPAR